MDFLRRPFSPNGRQNYSNLAVAEESLMTCEEQVCVFVVVLSSLHLATVERSTQHMRDTNLFQIRDLEKPFLSLFLIRRAPCGCGWF